MSKEARFYFDTAVDIFKKIESQCKCNGSINEAAELIYQAIVKDEVVHIIGT